MPPVNSRAPAKQYVQLSTEEQDLIAHVQAAEGWRDTAWEKYGEDWLGYVPTAINAAIYYYFDTLLPPYGLALYYCPVKDVTLHGGRGSAKTTTVALAMGMYTAIHPGEPWMHCSITKDQCSMAYWEIVRRGGDDGKHVRFLGRFHDGDPIVAPFPELRFLPWGPADTGNRAYFRPLGDENIERLRSLTVANLTVDEAFRDVETDLTYAQLRGCIRGINEFRLALLPEVEQREFRFRMYGLSMETNSARREIERVALDEWIKARHLQIRGLMELQGNAGPNDWEWVRHDHGRSDPAHNWSFTATYKDNPYFGEDNARALERSFGDNRELMEVEMLARRPRNLGDVFIGHNINQCLDPHLLETVQWHVNRGRAEDADWKIDTHTDFGVYHFEIPKVPGHLHVMGCDPGVGKAPLRNKWVITVWDISEKPVRMVAFEMGYLNERQCGDYNGFLQKLVYYGQVYPTAPGDIWVEATGPQKGMAQVGYPEQLALTAVEFTTQKPVLTNYGIQLLGHNLLSYPDVPQFLIELGNYTLPDKKITQDVVMAFIVACGGIWRYYGNDWEAPEAADDTPVTVSIDRYARPVSRGKLRRR